MRENESEKEKARKIFSALYREQEKWKPTFLDVRDFIYPYLGEFEGDEPNSAVRHDEFMLRTMPIKYANILASGLQWGITSPTRPWVKLGFNDDAIMQDSEVLNWLHSVEQIVLTMLSRGHFYPENQQFYLELGCFGTAAMFIEEDHTTGINCRTFTAGEYAIGLNAKHMPNAFARTISLKRDQMAEKFGEGFDYSSRDAINGYYTVKHLICPNKDYNADKIDKLSMKYREYYWIDGRGSGSNEFLSIGGYHEFPVTVGRWSTKGADVYGTGPGIWAMGDAKQIQVMARDITTGAELMVKPPVQAPSDILSNGGINLMPAAANYYNPTGQSDGGIRPVFETKMDFSGALAVQQAVEECIKEHFNTKVFQLLSDMEKGTRTAREVIELSAEKMSQMGPLVDRMETEILPQTIERVLAIGFRLNAFPPAPDIVQGRTMEVSYVSILAQAQKQSAITPIVDTVGQVIEMATATQLPEILDKIDFDEVVDQIGGLNGVPPSIIKSDDIVAKIREARAQQQQAMNQAAMMAQGAQAAKTMSQADLTGNNALVQVLGGPTGGLAQ